MTSQKEHKVVQSHKKLNVSHDFFCIELKLSAVVTLLTKFHEMSFVTFPWQQNGLQALSIFALVVHSVGVSEYGHYKAQAQESLLISGATNTAVFILGR